MIEMRPSSYQQLTSTWCTIFLTTDEPTDCRCDVLETSKKNIIFLLEDYTYMYLYAAAIFEAAAATTFSFIFLYSSKAPRPSIFLSFPGSRKMYPSFVSVNWLTFFFSVDMCIYVCVLLLLGLIFGRAACVYICM